MTRHEQTILVVDDNAETRWLVADVLRRAGYPVIEAEDGPAALDAVRDHEPDMILLDMMMPGMDGIEVVRRLKANPGLAAIPVVALTARRELADRAQALAAGCSRYVTKPCPPAALREIVAATLAGDAYPDQQSV